MASAGSFWSGWTLRNGAAVSVEIVPGIRAANAAGALLGAPLMNDVMAMSLSDFLTPPNGSCSVWPPPADSDLVVVLYNPRSRTRQDLLRAARSILMRQRRSSAPVGIVSDAYRPGCTVQLYTLSEMSDYVERVGIRSIVIAGNSESRHIARIPHESRPTGTDWS